MLRALFMRTLKPEVTYKQFKDAWRPEGLILIVELPNEQSMVARMARSGSARAPQPRRQCRPRRKVGHGD
jgi:hypothetical protein